MTTYILSWWLELIESFESSLWLDWVNSYVLSNMIGILKLYRFMVTESIHFHFGTTELNLAWVVYKSGQEWVLAYVIPIPTNLPLPPTFCETVIAGLTNSTTNHISAAPILATVFHQWARFGFGLGLIREQECFTSLHNREHGSLLNTNECRNACRIYISW